MEYIKSQARSVISVQSALSSESWLTLSELTAITGMAPRTLRYALKQLKAAGMLKEKLNFKDMRKIIYGLKSPVSQ